MKLLLLPTIPYANQPCRSTASHIDSLVAQAISPEDEEAAVEQTADYFDRHIAGDR